MASFNIPQLRASDDTQHSTILDKTLQCAKGWTSTATAGKAQAAGPRFQTYRSCVVHGASSNKRALSIERCAHNLHFMTCSMTTPESKISYARSIPALSAVQCSALDSHIFTMQPYVC